MLADLYVLQTVQDIEQLREHLGILSWVVFGGSWWVSLRYLDSETHRGSTLSLAYAQAHPNSVKALILRGISLGSLTRKLKWLSEDGVGSEWMSTSCSDTGLKR